MGKIHQLIPLFYSHLGKGACVINFEYFRVESKVNSRAAIRGVYECLPATIQSLPEGVGLARYLIGNDSINYCDGLSVLVTSQWRGSEIQLPLATVVVAGLVSSILLTLLVLPILSTVFHGAVWPIR